MAAFYVRKSSEYQCCGQLWTTATSVCFFVLLRMVSCLAETGEVGSVGVFENLGALRGHSAELAQSTVKKKQQWRDPIKPPCTNADGVSEVVLQLREEREQNGDKPLWSKSTAYAPSR
ncbi:hypothetical protein DFH06DRAFT_1153351 [Mycena polygramma]|nr:hypothetical protein DFH06DRAFT_1153351 [Mycena polygramma]